MQLIAEKEILIVVASLVVHSYAIKNDIVAYTMLPMMYSVLPLLMCSEKFLMSDVMATNLMLTGLIFLFTTFPLTLG